ncbi:MAG: molybdopterin-binding protein [Thermoplasmatales archaeon]
MKKIPTDDAVGKVLAYDTTLVTRTKSSTLLPRGHRITRKDVDLLKNSGVYVVWTEDMEGDLVYEWEISSEIAEKMSDGTTEVVKGEHGISFLVSKLPGLIKIDHENLIRFNLNQEVLLITKTGGLAVGKGETIAAIDVIPLGIGKKDMKKISSIVKKGMVRVSPFKLKKVGLVITGTEIFEKRKRDQYYSIIKGKCKKYGWDLVYREIVPDDQELETKAIMNAKTAGAQGIIITGGMSVDPTDRTPDAIRDLGAKVIAYGVPMKPTTMTMVSIWEGIPILGISAGGIRYREFNSIDLIFTKLMGGEIPSRREIAQIGEGGIFWSYDLH